MRDQPLPKTILILSANPKGTDPLRLDEELREIKAGMQRSRHRDQYIIQHQMAARPRDVQRAMLDFKPQIVHFCGHGAGETGLILENEGGMIHPVSAAALADLFALFAGQVECVVLNACYSEVQAEAIAHHIPAVIGMNQAIGDRAAIEFVTSFYDALGAGQTVEFAYKLGKNAMQLAGIAEENTPVLLQTPVLPQTVGAPTGAESTTESVTEKGRSQIFISYKRGFAPDEAVALEVYAALSPQHSVFIDQTMPAGTRWAEQIEAELRRSDFLIVFLTADSVMSEMVKGEIEMAHHLHQQHGKPTILPVRLAYQAPFTYPLSFYLDPINWAFWQSPEDTPRLIEELQRAITGESLSINSDRAKTDLTTVLDSASTAPPIPQPHPAAQPVSLEMPEGTMDAESQFYVTRASDAIALNAIQQKGVTITIKGPRQMGKSSLLIQVVDAAIKAEKRVAFLDFQLLDAATLANADAFFQQFCHWITEQMELPDRVGEYWSDGSGNSLRCTNYIKSYVLEELGKPLVLAMDEVDRVFDTDFQSDFFSMLRSWHNNRALPKRMMPIWRNLDLALVTATEPYHLIKNLNQSPFNVGAVIPLSDFTIEQVAALNRQHGSPLTLSQIQQLMNWVNGHPYLVRKALYLVASQQCTVDHLFAQATGDRGPFGDHLRYHLFRIRDRPDLLQGLKQVIQNQTCGDDRVLRLLSAAGLVYRDRQTVLPRCRLYAEFFWERLHG